MQRKELIPLPNIVANTIMSRIIRTEYQKNFSIRIYLRLMHTWRQEDTKSIVLYVRIYHACVCLGYMIMADRNIKKEKKEIRKGRKR